MKYSRDNYVGRGIVKIRRNTSSRSSTTYISALWEHSGANRRRDDVRGWGDNVAASAALHSMRSRHKRRARGGRSMKHNCCVVAENEMSWLKAIGFALARLHASRQNKTKQMARKYGLLVESSASYCNHFY